MTAPVQRSRPSTFGTTAQPAARLPEEQALLQETQSPFDLRYHLPFSQPPFPFINAVAPTSILPTQHTAPRHIDSRRAACPGVSPCQINRTSLSKASSGLEKTLPHPCSSTPSLVSTVQSSPERGLDPLRSTPLLPLSDSSHNRCASEDRGACAVRNIRHFRYSQTSEANYCSHRTSQDSTCRFGQGLQVTTCSYLRCSNRRAPYDQRLRLLLTRQHFSSLNRDGLHRHGSQPQLTGYRSGQRYPWEASSTSSVCPRHQSPLASDPPRPGHSAPVSRRASQEELFTGTLPPACSTDAAVVNTRARGLWRGRCCSLRQVVSRMLRLRYVGRCLLVLLLTAVGGLLAHATFRDHRIDSKPSGGMVTGGFAGGVKVGDGYESLLPAHMLMKMHLRSVPLREFQEKINQVDDEYDILRIFLADKDLSNEAIRQILMSRNDDEPVEIKKKRTESTDEFEDDDYEDSDPSSYMDGEYDGYLNDENRRSDRLLEELAEAHHHIEEVKMSPVSECRVPQPQIVNVEDPKKQGRILYPSCTVIYRCRNDSGCCGPREECGPKTERVVFKTFMLIKRLLLTCPEAIRLIGRPGRFQRPRAMRRDVLAGSVTMLGTSPVAVVYRGQLRLAGARRLDSVFPDTGCCNQKCPGVFRMYRRGWRCMCDCLTAPNEIFEQCENVKNGIKPLGEKDLVCIKSGECIKPACSVGEFDVSGGLCPLKNEYDLSLRLSNRPRHKRKSQTEGSGDD
ncbi:hypothetical protein C0Q70_06502 [Pomacea canaliculata]|uniref:Platelet-derived growth factor (PDGF) family profile domain-containing protein n=1 Tax=Pomacea canaliculata TaxID=400727 RepID=A0A2T7PP77_POMCA|nr:hypothetical protein C0Q70_06502 [Pomacea canaliculata]